MRRANNLFPSPFLTPFTKLHPASSLASVGSLGRNYLFLRVYMYPLPIPLVTLTLFRALRRCSVRNSCCAYATSSAYFHHPLLAVSSILPFPSSSNSVLMSGLPFFFSHQAFILAPIILGHPTYSDQSFSFYPAFFSNGSHATRCIMRGRNLVSLMFRFRQL